MDGRAKRERAAGRRRWHVKAARDGEGRLFFLVVVEPTGEVFFSSDPVIGWSKGRPIPVMPVDDAASAAEPAPGTEQRVTPPIAA